MKKPALLLVFLAVVLAACAPRAPDPDRFAAKFFDHGKDAILDSLRDQKASDAQLNDAQNILARYERTAPGDIAAAIRAHQKLMMALSSGSDTATLLKLESERNPAQLKALRTIGNMHEEIATAVGARTWAAATT